MATVTVVCLLMLAGKLHAVPVHYPDYQACKNDKYVLSTEYNMIM